MHRDPHSSSRRGSLLWVALLPWLAGACGGASVSPEEAHADRLAPQNLYPLDEGHVWSYNVDTGEEMRHLAITRVLSKVGSRVEVSSGGDPIVYELRPDGIWRSSSETWLLRAPVRDGQQWPAPSGRVARVTSTNATAATPAGQFEGCVQVDESGGDGTRTIRTLYCPGVGPVYIETTLTLEVAQPARVVAKLLGYAFE